MLAKLTAELKRLKDPREIGGPDAFDKFPYGGGSPKFPGVGKKKK